MINTNRYIGIGKRHAQNLAEHDNLVFRLVSANGETILGVPDNVQVDRLCVIIENDRVAKAWIG